MRGRKETNGVLALRSNQQEALGQSLSWSQVWLRRQETSQQQIPIELALMEGVKRTNVAMATPQQRTGFPQRNPYTMDVDR